MRSDGNGQYNTVFEALARAARLHNGQRRKDTPGSPHLKHIVQVLCLLSQAGIDDIGLLTAAALHDVLRDTDMEPAELRAQYGDRVAGIVEEINADSDLSRMDRREELPGIVVSFSAEAQLIKLAEKISNLNDLHEEVPVGWSRRRRREYFDWTQEVTQPRRGRNALRDEWLDEALSLRP